MIELEHLTKEYGGIPAIRDLTLRIGPGEIFGLLGPNGAGKSTTILMLIGLIEPTSGRCLVEGIDVARDPRGVKQRIGYMPEDVGFYGTLSAEENLLYFGRLYRMDPARLMNRIQELLTLTGLEGVAKPVGGYSKGMRQRLGLVKALLNDPPVVILDEPTANLDPKGVADYRAIVAGVAEQGKTVIVSTHILGEVSRVCTTLGILSSGNLVAHGTWEDLGKKARDGNSGSVTILLETRDPLPELDHPAIAGVAYRDGRLGATVTAAADIRDDLYDHLSSRGIRIREISCRERSLEEVFLSYYQVAG
ncbi:MAG: ABC transporter ATP-binding protein [Methanoregulaceae archaeon]